MISGRLSKGAGNALFSRVCEASHPVRDVVLFYIISCFCTYYDGKLGYKMGYRAKSYGVLLPVSPFLFALFKSICFIFLRIWIVFIIIQHSLAKYVIRLLISSNALDIG